MISLLTVLVSWYVASFLRFILIIGFTGFRPEGTNWAALAGSLFIAELFMLVCFTILSAVRFMLNASKTEVIDHFPDYIRRNVYRSMRWTCKVTALTTFIAAMIFFIIKPKEGERHHEMALPEVLIAEPADSIFMPDSVVELSSMTKVPEQARVWANAVAMAVVAVSLLLTINVFFKGFWILMNLEYEKPDDPGIGGLRNPRGGGRC